MTVQYTMQAGHRDMRCDVYASAPIEGLCTGVQVIPAQKGLTDIIHLTGEAGLTAQRSNSESSLSGKAGHCAFCAQLENGVLLASWGTDWPVNDSAKYAKETVGLAVFIPKAYAGDLVHDKQNNLCLLNLQSPISNHQSQMSCAHFYLTCCGATKENHPVATTAEEWLAYLRRWAKHLR